MSEISSSVLVSACEAIADHGDYVTARRTVRLDGLQFEHPRKGLVDIVIDPDSLREQGNVYTSDRILSRSLNARGIRTDSLGAAGQVLEEAQERGCVWGFSGFASAGFEYRTEAEGLSRLYTYLDSTGMLPSLSVDGGVSAGNLGLNSLIARMHGVPTMGIIPLQGLASTGISNDLVIWGNTYRDREAVVGTAPKMLVCIGGGEGTQRECLSALRYGSAVLLLALKDYGPQSLPSTYTAFPEMREALSHGNMVVCDSLGSIPASVDQLLENGGASDQATRLNTLNRLLQG